MTFEIIIVLSILILAIILFITEKIRVDIVALIVLVSLTLTGLITPAEALSGFSNPAVVTVWAILILSSALSRTGVATLIGRPLRRLGAGSEARLIALIMLLVGVLSGFMNNIGVAALMLPVVVDIARKTGRPPSRLLIPLAFGSHLGGLNTLIGTPPNILISDALRQYGAEPFRMFDYTPTGIVALLAGIVFMVLIGRHLLPSRDIMTLSDDDQETPGEFFGLQERLFVIQLPAISALDGKTLGQSRMRAALGLNVLAILREEGNQLAPDPSEVLQAGDRLLVEGQPDRLVELRGQRTMILEADHLDIEQLQSPDIDLAELAFSPKASMAGLTLEQLDFRNRYGAVVLAVRRGERVIRTNLEDLRLEQGDFLLVQASPAKLDELRTKPEFHISDTQPLKSYHLEDRLMAIRLPQDSTLVGKKLAESRLGDAFGLGVMAIIHGGVKDVIPDPERKLEAGDLLLVKGRTEDLQVLDGLKNLETNDQAPPNLSELESEQVGMAEVVLSPRTTLTDKSLRQIHFRNKYGLSVLAIWRQGRAFRTNLRDMALKFGDALLVYGRRDRMQILGEEPDFLVLTEGVQKKPLLKKAPLALAITVAVLLPVIFDLIPIAIAILAGVILMILTGCLTMEEAYQAIEWKAVFLIAGMLPLGIAMEQSGAAHFLADSMVGLVGGFGPIAVMAGLFLLAAIASQVMPNPAVAVLLAPIAFNTANDLGISPYPAMMVIAISASAAFLSPVGHPANILVMGPGGYRFSDFTKVGIPLTILILFVTLVIVPLVWPL
jgi:di/tricarboxylate transporter